MHNQPLRGDDAVVVFIDLQEGIVNVGATADPERLRTCVSGLAQLATIFALPVAIACVPTTSGTVAPLLQEIAVSFPDAPFHTRTTANPLDDEAFRSVLTDTGRRTLILAGVATEVAVALSASTALRLGYRVIVAVDACSGIDLRSESATLMHLGSLGITLSSVLTIAAELAGDFGSDHGRAAMRVLQSMLAPHGHGHSEHEHEHQHTRHPSM